MRPYSGPERRRHRVLVTNNTEYHMRGRICVGVRDASGGWQVHHRSLGTQLIAAVSSGGQWIPYEGGPPPVGTRLLFSNQTLTSPIKQIERPALDLVRAHYPAAGATDETAG